MNDLSRATFIAHRINTSQELMDIDPSMGVEVDLRDYQDDLILAHDPFVLGESFENYLKGYKHGTMILNIKSERIEWRVLELMEKYKVGDYFFLDSSFPMIYQLSVKKNRHVALRYSEFEPLDFVLMNAKMAEWVWVDCFSRLPINPDSYSKLKDAGLKVCIVSPELQGQPEKIPDYRDYLLKNMIIPDAICTKYYHKSEWLNE